jgi:hypothetical protein
VDKGRDAGHATENHREYGHRPAGTPGSFLCLRNFAERWHQSVPFRLGRGHRCQIPAFLRQLATHRSPEIFVQRIEGIGLQFAENTAQFLLDPVYGVKETAPVHIEAAAAQLPVRSQQIVEFENPIFFFVENPAGNEAEISHIFLIFSTPYHAPVAAAGHLLETNRAHVFFFLRAMPEAGVASLENPPQYAIAG